jgi:hypothetical protein
MLSLLLLHLNLIPALVPLPVQCDGTDLSACRKELWKYVFNTTTGALPSKSEPDFITHPDWEMRGLPGPGQGTGVGNVSWKMGLQKLVWTIGAPGGGMRPGMLRLIDGWVLHSSTVVSLFQSCPRVMSLFFFFFFFLSVH